MNEQQALQLLEQALNLATQKGAFNMAEVVEISKALTILKQPKEDEN